MILFYLNRVFRHKILNLVGIVLVIYVLRRKLTPTEEKVLDLPPPNLTCYRMKDVSLPDLSAIKPKRGRSIFFVDASCSSHEEGKIVISTLHACSIESAARRNPKMDVYLLYTSPGIIKNERTVSDRILKTLLGYPNIKICRLDYEEFIKGTPAEDLNSEFISSLSHPVQYAGDLLAVLLLWKYGGLHLSQEMLVLKSMEDLWLNFLGFSLEFEPSTSVFSLSPVGDGHDFAAMCLGKLVATLKENRGTYSSQAILLRSLQEICNVSNFKDIPKLRECKGITLFKTSTFYPIPWWYLSELSEDTYNYEISKLISNSYTMELPDLLVHPLELDDTSSSPLVWLTNEHCPKVFSEIYVL